MEVKTARFDKIVNSCRICRSSAQDGDCMCLYAETYDEEDETASATNELTEVGKLYEELLRIKIDPSTMDFYPQFVCNSCDLQLRLFEKMVLKARRTLMELSKLYKDESHIDEKKHETQDLYAMDNEKTHEDLVYLQECSKSVNSRNGPEILPHSISNSSREQNKISETRIQEIAIVSMENEELEESDDESFYIDIKDNDGMMETKTTTQIIENKVQDYKEIECISIDKAKESETELLVPRDSNEFLDVHYLEEADDNLNFADTKDTTVTPTKSKRNNKPTKKRSYTCHACSLLFSKRADYIKHRKSNHGSKFPCPSCPKQCNTSDALRVHMQMHAGKPAYECELCGKTFNQKVHYKYHMDRHNDVRNFKCTQCQKAFLAKADLSVHMRKHTGERPYECEICGKTYVILQHLKMHRFSHFDKSFECNICKQKFTSPVTLNTHIKSIHSSVPLFQCEFCVKRFNRKHHLHAHYKVHRKPSAYINIGVETDIDSQLVTSDNLTEGNSEDGFMEIPDDDQIECIMVDDSSNASHALYGDGNVIVF